MRTGRRTIHESLRWSRQTLLWDGKTSPPLGTNKTPVARRRQPGFRARFSRAVGAGAGGHDSGNRSAVRTIVARGKGLRGQRARPMKSTVPDQQVDQGEQPLGAVD